MQKRYKEIKTWFPLYSSKYLWIIFPLFACLWGKHLSSTSPRNPTQSKFLAQQRSLPLEKCSGIANGCCFWYHQWLVLGVAGWQVGWKQSTSQLPLSVVWGSFIKTPGALSPWKAFLLSGSQKISSPYLLMVGQVIPESCVIYQQNGVIPWGQAMVMPRS